MLALTSSLRIAGLAVLTVMLASACLPDAPSSPKSPQEALSAGATQAALMAPPTATAFIIEYVISGEPGETDQPVDIRWQSDGTEDTDVDVNVSDGVWSRFVTVKPGSQLVLEATNSAPDDPRLVRCEIFLSGQLWDSNEAVGAAMRASCDAIAGW
jgi:hypothetical protein